MATEIAGLPFWELTFDADGDPDGAQSDAFLAEVPAHGLTDVIVLAHGWNNDRRTANELYQRIFDLLGPQLPAAARGTVGLAGVTWPSERWADEPIPDFLADGSGVVGGGVVGDGAVGDAGIGTADLGEPAAAPVAADPALDAATLAGLRAQFPAATAPLEEMARLLAGPETDAALTAFHGCLGEFSRLAGGSGAGGSGVGGSGVGGSGAADDGEGDKAGAALPPGAPRMLLDPPTVLFERYRDALVAAGVALGGGVDGVDGVDGDDGTGGAAGFGAALGQLLHGAKEALRGATYWQMKNRAGTVGRAGLGPLLGRLPAGVRIHLVGHSFGGRLVSFALSGLPAGRSARAVTLLQGAFSHFTFAGPLPFDAGRDGALAGMLGRIDGPLTVCFSEHDGALGRFYPLASFAAQEDSATAVDPTSRWGAMGANGAQGVHAALAGIGPVGARYGFVPGAVLNVDASEIVKVGPPPIGAHGDIVHAELTWVVLAAGGLV